MVMQSEVLGDRKVDARHESVLYSFREQGQF
jgi:hypothetical protein